MPTNSSQISDQRKTAAEKEIKAKQQEVKYDMRDFTIDYIVKQFQDDLFYIPDYQREFVWDLRRQRRFIESVILGLPIPMMFVADMEDGRLEIVDGAQRIQTLEAFQDDSLQLEGLTRLATLNGFKHSDLPIAQQRKFGTKALRLVVLDDSTSLETRQEIFDRVNTSGLRAKASEVRRGAYSGPFMTFVTECAKDPIFVELCPISDNQRSRREGEELVLRFFAYSDRYKDFQHDVDGFLDQFVEDHQKKFDKKRLKGEFRLVLEFVKQCFPNGFAKSKKARTTPRVRFESIAVGVNLALREKPDLAPRQPDDWLESAEFKYHTTTHASNSQPRLAGRIEYVRTRLLEGAR